MAAAAKIRRLWTDNTPFCNGTFAIVVIYHLTGPVERVRTNRDVDDAVVAFIECDANHRFHDCNITFLHGAVVELALERVVGFGGAWHDKYARCVHVKTVYGLGSISAFGKDAEYRVALAFPGYGE